MSPAALALVLLSAANHASWNLLVKTGRDKYALGWWMMAAGFLLTLPVLLLLPVRFTAASLGLLAASSVAEALYLLTLAASYQRLDYTVAYPVARGSAPVFIALFATLMLGERISTVGLAGILLVSVGIFTLHLRRPAHVDARHLLFPLASGACIGTFSVADKAALRFFHPLALGCLIFGGTAVVLWPYLAWIRRSDLVGEFRAAPGRAVTIALLSLGGYALVLAAMARAPVSYVGAARESSVLFAALLGWLVLREGFGLRRFIAACVIFCGIACLALAR